MLRSRLYIGMSPVAGLLIATCLYSIISYRALSDKLFELQTEHYAAISRIDQLLLATSQAERAIRLRETGNTVLAEQIREKSQQVFESWIIPESSSSPPPKEGAETELSFLVEELEQFTRNAFTSDAYASNEDLADLLKRTEAAAMRSITARNDKILEIDSRSRKQSRIHFFIVIGGIAASILIMVTVAHFLSQRILKPIDALANSASELAGDKWETDYKPTSKDEVARLETAFVDLIGRVGEFKQTTSREIARTTRRMEECFNNLPHPIFFLNTDRAIVYRNSNADRLIKALDWDKRLPSTLASRIESVFGTGEEVLPRDFEETVTFKVDNVDQHFLPIVVRIDSEDIAPIECGVFLQDITYLRLSDELKSDLVATLSHEIKTPVTSATMALHLLLEKGIGDLNEDQEDMILTANADLRRLQRLLEHMLPTLQPPPEPNRNNLNFLSTTVSFRSDKVGAFTRLVELTSGILAEPTEDGTMLLKRR